MKKFEKKVQFVKIKVYRTKPIHSFPVAPRTMWVSVEDLKKALRTHHLAALEKMSVTEAIGLLQEQLSQISEPIVLEEPVNKLILRSDRHGVNAVDVAKGSK